MQSKSWHRDAKIKSGGPQKKKLLGLRYMDMGDMGVVHQLCIFVHFLCFSRFRGSGEGGGGGRSFVLFGCMHSPLLVPCDLAHARLWLAGAGRAAAASGSGGESVRSPQIPSYTYYRRHTGPQQNVWKIP